MPGKRPACLATACPTGRWAYTRFMGPEPGGVTCTKARPCWRTTSAGIIWQDGLQWMCLIHQVPYQQENTVVTLMPFTVRVKRQHCQVGCWRCFVMQLSAWAKWSTPKNDIKWVMMSWGFPRIYCWKALEKGVQFFVCSFFTIKKLFNHMKTKLSIKFSQDHLLLFSFKFVF